MIEKTFNIFCDENTHLEHDGHPYMLYGYVSIASNQIKICKEQIKAIKEKYAYTDELKWVNIHDKTYQVYKDLVDYFFLTDMKFKVVIADKTQIDASRTEYTFNDFYYRMYFQLLHLTTEEIEDADEQGNLYKHRVYDRYRSERLHWI